MPAKAFRLLAAAALAVAVPAPQGDTAAMEVTADVATATPTVTETGTDTAATTDAASAASAASASSSAAYASSLTESEIAAAAATALTLSDTSDVKGKAFNRILEIMLETTSYDNAIADPNCQALIKQGILLTQMYGVGAPSQPNYIAPASGDTFGLNSDSYIDVDKNVSTIVDLLEDKGISWSDYNEGLPYTGYDGFMYSNPKEGNYMRKHNLLQRFESIQQNPKRQAHLKNLTLFYEDLENERLPQWSFLTPNLYNDGHDTNISVSCNFTRSFVEPLLKNEYFNRDKTLIYITWQANGQNGTERNHVAGILLGSAVPENLVGTTDDAYHNHYSEISSVEANWGLHHLGRWDVGANVWEFVASQTGDQIREWNEEISGDKFENYYWNQSYGGVFSSEYNTTHTYVAPNLDLVQNGRTILPAIASLWGGSGAAPKKVKRGGDAKGKGKGGKGGKGGKVCKPKYTSSASQGTATGTNTATGTVTNTATQSTTMTSSATNTVSTGYGGLPDYYRNIIELPDAFHPPAGFQVSIGLMPAMPITTPITAYPYQTATA